ncbi:MAG: DegV family protein [Candidatus Geothermincolia bacterium]
MKKRVALITESQICLPQELVDEYGITILPFLLILEDREYRDGIDMTAREFYEMLPTLNGAVARTAPVSPGEYLKAFMVAARDHEGALVVTISDKMSASFQSALVAAEQFGQIPVRIVDSKTAAGAQGLVVLETARAIAAGAGLEEAFLVAQSARERVELYAYIDTFDYLKRSGRVKAVQAMAATALSIKPVLQFKNGDAVLSEMKRNARKARRAIAERARRTYEASGPLILNLLHANAIENCRDLGRMIASNAAIAEEFCTEFTPVMGAHTGPGLVGAAFMPAHHPR